MKKYIKLDEAVDSDDIVDTIDPVIDEVMEAAYVEPVVEPKEFSIEQPLGADELALCKKLSGTPCCFDTASVVLLERLQKRGLAADFGDGLWGRGHKWSSRIGK